MNILFCVQKHYRKTESFQNFTDRLEQILTLGQKILTSAESWVYFS